MADYSLVDGPGGAVCGLWLRREADARNHELLGMLLVKHGLPQELFDAVSRGSYRVVPNRFDSAGGCFVMFGAAPAPGESKTKGSGTKAGGSSGSSGNNMGLFRGIFRKSKTIQGTCFYHPNEQAGAECALCQQRICAICTGEQSRDADLPRVICQACSRLKTAMEGAGVPVGVPEMGGAVSGYYLLGGLALRAGKAQEAISHYELGVKLAKARGDDKLTAGCLNGIGQAYVSLKKPDKALGYHQECMRLAPNDGTYHEALVIAYWALGRIAEARSELNRLIATGHPVYLFTALRGRVSA